MHLIELVKKKTMAASVALLLVFCWVNSAAARGDDTWDFEATVYLWYTDIGGTLNIPGGGVPGGPFRSEASSVLDNLEMVFMGTFEARKNKWSFLADGIYLDLGNDKETTVTVGRQDRQVNASIDMNITAWVLTGLVGYDVVQTDRGTLAVVGGARYTMLDVDTTLALQGLQTENSESDDLVDGVVGVRGAVNLNERWYFPYYADIGAGSSDLTWQALAGIGYRFSWGDAKLVYRYLKYELDDKDLLQDLDVSGPVFGLSFRF